MVARKLNTGSASVELFAGEMARMRGGVAVGATTVNVSVIADFRKTSLKGYRTLQFPRRARFRAISVKPERRWHRTGRLSFLINSDPVFRIPGTITESSDNCFAGCVGAFICAQERGGRIHYLKTGLRQLGVAIVLQQVNHVITGQRQAVSKGDGAFGEARNPASLISIKPARRSLSARLDTFRINADPILAVGRSVLECDYNRFAWEINRMIGDHGWALRPK
jgi:hypothetical protein